jgi:hypothetical protein
MRGQETGFLCGAVLALAAGRGMAGFVLVQICPRISMALGHVGDNGELRASGHPD